MKYRHYVLALGAILATTIYLSSPIFTNFSGLISNGGEELLVSSIIAWNRHALKTDITQIFNMPYMHPTKNTLAFSDYFITQGIISLPLDMIFRHPVITYNSLILLGLVLNPMCFYLLAHELTKKPLASFLGAMVFGFSVGRLDVISHLQVFNMYWLILSLLMLVKYLKNPQTKFLAGMAVFGLAQGLDTVFMTFVLLFCLIIIAGAYQVKVGLEVRKLKALLLTWLLLIVGLGIIYLPYYQVTKLYRYTRTLKDAFGGSAYWADYLYPSQGSNLRILAEAIWNKQPWTAYMGALLSVLLISGIWLYWRQKKSWEVLAALTMLVVGLVMSFGPFFQIIRHQHLFNIKIPLPYLLFYYLIPGFKSMRVPQRWSHMEILGASLLITLMLTLMFSKIKQKGVIPIIAVILLLVIVLEVRRPIFASKVPEVNPAYGVLSKFPKGVVLELPANTYPYPMTELEVNRLYQHSLIIGKGHKYINGYSGFAAPDWSKKILKLQESPEALTQTITEFNPDYLLVNDQQWGKMSEKIGSKFNSSQLLETIELLPYILIEDTNGEKLYRNVR